VRELGKGEEGKLMEHQMGSLVQGSLEAFCKGSPWSGYLDCICSAILGGLLGKRTVECMERWSTFPPFYRTYLIEWYYN
jgi:hypothetical protein